MELKSKKKKNVLLCWVPEHTGIEGNEIADKYAKLAVSNTDTVELDLIPYDDFKNSVKALIREKWHTFWNS